VANAKFEVIHGNAAPTGPLVYRIWQTANGAVPAHRSRRREVTVSWALIQSTAWGRRRSRSPIRPTTPRN